jgi:peptidoglycan/xylan/chitin deacetylase (PgdA/CDA1 family)
MRRWMAHPAAIGLALVGLAACESTPVLLYHSVGESFDSPRHVSAERFRVQMEWLVGEGYTIITARDLEAIELGSKPRPHRAIALTFDDGYRNFYEHAFPILTELGIPATIFIITSRSGEDEATRVVTPIRHLIWPEILELERAGIDVESHSVTHPHLRGLARDVVYRETHDSKLALEARLGREVSVFAYPNGSEDKVAREVVEAAGYRTAFSVSSGLDGAFDRQRISIHDRDDLAAFRNKIGGTWWGEASGERP